MFEEDLEELAEEEEGGLEIASDEETDTEAES